MTDTTLAPEADRRRADAAAPDRLRALAVAGKRLFDMAAGFILLLLLLPALVAVTLVLLVQSRGRPFFSHHRAGLRGDPLWFPKFRTLVRETAPYADKITVDLKPISDFAAWLRRRHLDELPQLLLVAMGRMSLVGPRPRMFDEIETYRWPEFDDARVLVRQGCTGLWQIGQHRAVPVSANPEYDLFYMRRASLRMDLWIMWRTAIQALGVTPITLDQVPRWTYGTGLLSAGAIAVSTIEFTPAGTVSEPSAD